MPFLKPAITLLCAAGALGAQAPVDLNGLAAAAIRYASHGVAGQHNPPALDLRLMRGDNGGDAQHLMAKATDVARWTIFYDASYGKAPAQAELVKPRSASVKCIKGAFTDFFMAEAPVPNLN